MSISNLFNENSYDLFCNNFNCTNLDCTNLFVNSNMLSEESAASINVGTLTASALRGGIVFSVPPAPTVLTSDTAANIVASINNPQVGQIFKCLVGNYAVIAGRTLSITTGLGVSFPNGTIPLIDIQESRVFYIQITDVTPGSENVVIY
jgi:hypothetical protein